MRQIRQLEESRQDEATLVGASPRELTITFKSTDLAGHMAVVGHVGWDQADGFVRKLEFGFEFDPGLLAGVVRDLETFGQS